MPMVMVEVVISKVSSSSSALVTWKNRQPSFRFSLSHLMRFSTSARLFSSKVMIFVSSSPTETRLEGSVFISSPLCRRTLS